MSDLKITIDDLAIETHDAWSNSIDLSQQVDRKAIQEIACRVEKANFEHILNDSQPLKFKAPNSFASFTAFFLDPKEMFTFRLFDEEKIEYILEKLEEDKDDQEEGNSGEKYDVQGEKKIGHEKNKILCALFSCIKTLNKDCQEIQNNRDRCQKG